jgi:hypothetical protein
MVAFSNSEQAKILHEFVDDLEQREGITNVPLSRPEIWAASQAIRDLLDGAAFRTDVSNAIDAAISPKTMTNAQKKRLFGRVIRALWLGEVS